MGAVLEVAGMTARQPIEPEPIRCDCREYRHGRMAPHHDHRAEYERARLAGRIPDDVWYQAIVLDDLLRVDCSSVTAS
jgi:hypothetical protein